MEAIVKEVWLLAKQMKEWRITTVEYGKSYVLNIGRVTYN